MDENLSKMIERCMHELSEAHEGRYSPEKAERTAALFLDAQMRLTDMIAEAEFKRQMAKNELERISAEKYFLTKSASTSSVKLTEEALKHALSKDEDVYKVKEAVAKAESEQRKWQNVLGIMSNGHIFFRNVGKNM